MLAIGPRSGVEVVCAAVLTTPSSSNWNSICRELPGSTMVDSWAVRRPRRRERFEQERSLGIAGVGWDTGSQR
jgi:hypothetical protein